MIGRRAVPRRLPINGHGDPGARGSAGCPGERCGAGAYLTAWGDAGTYLAACGGVGAYLGARCGAGRCLGVWGAGGHADVTWRADGHAGARRGAGGSVDARWGAGGRVGACQGGSGRLERSIRGRRYASLRALVAASDEGWARAVRRPSGWIGPRAPRGSSAPGWESVRSSAWVSGSRGLRSPARVRPSARVRVVGGGRWASVVAGADRWWVSVSARLDRRWASVAGGSDRWWLGSLERLERPGRAPSGGSGMGPACGVGRIVRDSREGAR